MPIIWEIFTNEETEAQRGAGPCLRTQGCKLWNQDLNVLIQFHSFIHSFIHSFVLLNQVELIASYLPILLVGHKTGKGAGQHHYTTWVLNPCRVFQMGPETLDGRVLRTLFEKLLVLKNGSLLFPFE